ncbi:MAG: hypothetical protein U0075_14690 [Thermomicrobiales bacterium]
MDGNRFDDVARTLQAGRPRRGVFGLLLGGALGLAGLAESQAKGGKGGGKGKGKKKKKKPTTCMKAAATCGGSSCGMGDTCCASIDCDCRQGLYCNFTDPKSESGTCGCMPGEIMHNGRCGTKKDCIPAGGKRYFGDKLCCSGSEHSGGPNTIYGICDAGDLACLTDADCTGGSCRGYMCYAPELDCNIYYN